MTAASVAALAAANAAAGDRRALVRGPRRMRRSRERPRLACPTLPRDRSDQEGPASRRQRPMTGAAPDRRLSLRSYPASAAAPAAQPQAGGAELDAMPAAPQRDATAAPPSHRTQWTGVLLRHRRQ